MKDFDRVEGDASGGVLDLMTATRSRCRDQCIHASITNGGEKDEFADLLRHRIVLRFVAEGPGHAAAAARDDAHPMPGRKT